MKYFTISFILLAIAAFLSGCSDQGTTPTSAALNDPQNAVAAKEVSGVKLAESSRNYITHLTGAEEVPTPVLTRAQGQAIFRLSEDGNSLSYRLIVANIQNVTMAHIHLGATGTNGGIVVWLYPSGPPSVLIPGRFQGVLARGTITASNLVGTLAGEPLSSLIDELNAGNAYVNVHTEANPGGEIRGQID